MILQRVDFVVCKLAFLNILLFAQTHLADAHRLGHSRSREEIKLDVGWRFLRTENNTDGLTYDYRNDTPPAAIVLKPWILPSANDFIDDSTKHYHRPASEPDVDVPYIQKTFNDDDWETVTVPHDWAIKGPFYQEDDAPVLGPAGRLPIQGVGWYRRNLTKVRNDEGSSIYLEIEGAQSYAMVWVNEHLVGGWPFGYSSFRLDITPYLEVGNDNILAIRLDNGVLSSRFYPGAGLYRDVWLTKVPSVQVSQYGTFIRSRDVCNSSATLDLAVQIDNKAKRDQKINIVTTVHTLDRVTGEVSPKLAMFPKDTVTVKAGERRNSNRSITIRNPRLWGPPPAHKPHLYVATTRLYGEDQNVIDSYETKFGIRSTIFDSDNGLIINGQRTYIQGVNQHHDLGALGAAFNIRAAERQLEMLQDMGCNAIRMAHNPPAPALLDLTDKYGFLVIDEIFDQWERNKTTNDFHLIFSDWHEPNLRSFLRRDRNHPSVISWSYGNEVREQDSGIDGRGVSLSRQLRDIVHHEDPTRPASQAQCCVGPTSPFSEVPDIINLNYRGEGIGDRPAYSNNQTTASTTHPEYRDFHIMFPEKFIIGSEYAASLSTRGVYAFPVTNDSLGVPVGDESGGNSSTRHISSYDLYTTDAGSSPDRVFEIQDKYSFVAGGFIWSGFDYIGEPHPYLRSRSSSFGAIDLAGFPKDRFYLYQARWRQDLRTAHILPHWTWPDRVGQITPVHVHSGADEAELFLNGKSQGRLEKAPHTYRFRWDNVLYEPGELTVTTYKSGQEWATAAVGTAGPPAKLNLTADRSTISGDGLDLSFITAEVTDDSGVRAPRAADAITFSVVGEGEIIATDNGDSTDTTVFASTTRKAFNGLALAIVKAKRGTSGSFTITATAPGLASAVVIIKAN